MPFSKFFPKGDVQWRPDVMYRHLGVNGGPPPLSATVAPSPSQGTAVTKRIAIIFMISMSVVWLLLSREPPEGVVRGPLTKPSPPTISASGPQRERDRVDTLSCDTQPVHLTQRCFDARLRWTQRDGLLFGQQVADERLHPLVALIEDAQHRWFDKLRGQSRSIEQAKLEYRRRYGVRPPAGYSAWWRWARQNDVLLSDEYDQLMESMLPLLSLSPGEFRRRQSKIDEERMKPKDLPWASEIHRFEIVDGQFGEMDASMGRMKAQTDRMGQWMEIWKEAVPGGPKDLVFSVWPHDEPFGGMISGEERILRTQAGRDGKRIDAMLPAPPPADLDAFSAACPPGSPMREGRANKTPDELESYIVDWRAALDICRHPEVRQGHGLFEPHQKLGREPRITSLWPILSFSATSISTTVLTTPIDLIHDDVGLDPNEWSSKTNKLLWRGGTSGAVVVKGVDWGKTHRGRLIKLANELTGRRAVRWCTTHASDFLKIVSLPAAKLHQHLFDIKLAGDSTGRPQPQMCDDQAGCRHLTEDFAEHWAPHMPPAVQNGYRYVYDMDGNGEPGRFRRLLASPSAAFKTSLYREWNSEHYMPWFHFVPVQVDLSDLEDIMSFFVGLPADVKAEIKGDLVARGTHHELAARIARNGREFAQQQWRDIDWQVYLARVLIEWHRVVHRDEED